METTDTLFKCSVILGVRGGMRTAPLMLCEERKREKEQKCCVKNARVFEMLLQTIFFCVSSSSVCA